MQLSLTVSWEGPKLQQHCGRNGSLLAFSDERRRHLVAGSHRAIRCLTSCNTGVQACRREVESRVEGVLLEAQVSLSLFKNSVDAAR